MDRIKNQEALKNLVHPVNPVKKIFVKIRVRSWLSLCRWRNIFRWIIADGHRIWFAFEERVD